MIFVDLLLTVVVYLLFPVAYRLIKGAVPAKKARVMSLVNTIICAIIFTVFQMILFADDPTFIPSVAPAFLYYFIGKAILKEKEKR